MRQIAGILMSAGVAFGYAAVGNIRCHPGNAYKADGIISFEGKTLKTYTDRVFVECEVAGAKPVAVIDHHRPGDSGYDLPPSKYWEASSLGQLISFLAKNNIKVSVSKSWRVLAAMDHCRAAALQGECPGVSGSEVLALRVKEIAQANSVSESNVRRRVDDYRFTVRKVPPMKFGGAAVVDLREFDLGVGYSVDLLCMQTALDVEGKAGLLRHRDVKNGPEKTTLSGHVTPAMVRYFLDIFAPAQGLTKTYGVPARGYAGGYMS